MTATVATQSMDGPREGGLAPATALIIDPNTGQPMTLWGDEFAPVDIRLNLPARLTRMASESIPRMNLADY